LTRIARRHPNVVASLESRAIESRSGAENFARSARDNSIRLGRNTATSEPLRPPPRLRRVGRTWTSAGRRSRRPLPTPPPSPTTVRAMYRHPPGVVAPPRQNPTPRRSPRDHPRQPRGRTSEGNPSSLSPERLRLPRCPGNLSLGLATTASVHRGSIHRVPSPRSFSSGAFSKPLLPAAVPRPRLSSSSASSPDHLYPAFSLSLSLSLRAPLQPSSSLPPSRLPLRLGPTLAGLYPSTLVPTSSRVRERGAARESGVGIRVEKKRGGTAPPEANRINVSRIIHAYFRGAREKRGRERKRERESERRADRSNFNERTTAKKAKGRRR